MTQIRIVSDPKWPNVHIELDGTNVEEWVTRADLSLRPGHVPTLDLEFLAFEKIVELDGRVRWLAWGCGESANGGDPVAVLRALADKIAAQTRTPEPVA